MYERESVARELDETPRIVNLARGGKVLEITKSKPKKAEIIEFPGAASFEAMVKKVKENLGLKKLVATTIIGLTAAMGATALSGVTAKNDDKSVIEFEEDANSNNIVKINPAVDNIVTVGSTKIAPPVVITTPETEAASEAETEPTVEIESISESEATYEPEVAAESEPDIDSDFTFKATHESTTEPATPVIPVVPEQSMEQTTTAADEAAIAVANEATTQASGDIVANTEATKTPFVTATGNKDIETLRQELGLYDGNGKTNINNKFGNDKTDLANRQTQALNTFDQYCESMGISQQDKANWAYIIGRESSFDPSAVSKSKTYTGLGQMSPDNVNTYASNPDAYRNGDALTQIDAAYKYILSRHGSIANAKAHWDKNGWY